MPLTSSMQPISTSRWPATGSSPVVSVSSTISRNPCLLGESPATRRHCSNCIKNGTHLGTRVVDPARGVHDEISAPALLVIRHLLAENGLELLPGHSGARQHTGLLNLRGRGCHHDRVYTPIASGLEQERDIEHSDLLAASLRLREKLLLGGLHQRVHDGFESFQCRGIIENQSGQGAAIDLAARGCAGKRGLDCGG